MNISLENFLKNYNIVDMTNTSKISFVPCIPTYPPYLKPQNYSARFFSARTFSAHTQKNTTQHTTLGKNW